VSVAECSFLLDRLLDAATYARQAFGLSCGIGDRTTATYALAVRALVAWGRGDDESAGRLWGAIEAEEERTFLGGWQADREEYSKRILTARAQTSSEGSPLAAADLRGSSRVDPGSGCWTGSTTWGSWHRGAKSPTTSNSSMT
jgi:hypothetical protein